MKLAIRDGALLIAEADTTQTATIKSWGKTRWDKKNHYLTGPADLELLDRMATLVRLPPGVEAYRNRLKEIQAAVDRERMDEHPAPLLPFPVTLPLYAHQIRAANMALLTFGWVEPGSAGKEGMQ